MGVVVDPDTGRLVSDAVDKAIIDSKVRGLIPVNERALDRSFGTTFYDALDGHPQSLEELPASIQAALVRSPFYTFVNARVRRDGSDGLRVDVSIDIPGVE